MNKENKPLVTIVTVTYNIIKEGRKNFFKQCLESVHNQTYENVEHVVIDGASDDGTAELIKEYADKGWIKYISEPDNGIYDAMNKGIKMAKGKYVAFLNSDDYYHNNKAVELSSAMLEKENADFSYADAISKSEDKENIFKGNVNTFLYDMPFAHLTMFTKKEVLLKEGCFNKKYGLPADYELIIRILLKDYKSVYIEDKIATYRPVGATAQHINDYSDDIKNIYYDNYSAFYNFTDEQQAIDIKYKKEIPVDFVEKFVQYAGDKYNNLIINNIEQQMATLKKQDKAMFTGRYSQDDRLKLSLGDKVISKESYNKYIDNIYKHNKKNISPKASVIIVAYNEGKDILRNLDSFKNQTSQNFEIILVDNGLDDDTKEKLKEYSLMHIVLNKNIGPSAGRNIGACYAQSELLAFIDADGYVNECYIESAIEIMKDRSKIAVRGKVLPTINSVKLPPKHYDLGNEQIPSLPDTEGNLIIRKSDYISIGGMEDSLFGHEGIVMAYRMLKYYKYNPDSICYDSRLVLFHDFAINNNKLKEKKERYKYLNKLIRKTYSDYDDIVKYYADFRRDGFYIKQKDKQLQQKEEIIKQKNKELTTTKQELSVVIDSKSYKLGNLFFRSVQKPYKLVTFPYNFIKILLEKQHKCLSGDTQEVDVIDDSIKVAIIMTAYNSSEFIAKSIESILNQTYKNLELIIVDDCSSDDTLQIIKSYQQKDSRIKLIESKKNRGTYWAKNYAIMFCDADFITTQDSDDISDSMRIELQLKKLLIKKADISYCNYIRVNKDGEKILNRGVYERVALMGMMASRSVFEKIGYFDSVRFAADSEMYERIQKFYPKDKVVCIEKPLYIALDRDGSLTTKDSKIDLSKKQVGNSKKEDLSFLSPDRQSYVESYREWHNSNNSVFMKFPQQNRNFVAPKKMLKNITEDMKYNAVASMASFPAREQVLKKTIGNILPQIDKLNIYLNDYDEVPDFLKHKKINVVSGKDEVGDLRDNGKIFFVNQLKDNTYHFLIDDDLIYPDDYVQKMIAKLQFYDNKVIVGVHGSILPVKIDKFFSKDRKVFHFQEYDSEDRSVNLLGTGTVAYHASILDIDIADFKTKGMADLWFTILCKKQKIPMISVERRDKWLREFDNETPKLWEEFKGDDVEQTKIARRYEPWYINKI